MKTKGIANASRQDIEDACRTGIKIVEAIENLCPSGYDFIPVLEQLKAKLRERRVK